jgi:hypothetical protein
LQEAEQYTSVMVDASKQIIPMAQSSSIEFLKDCLVNQSMRQAERTHNSIGTQIG